MKDCSKLDKRTTAYKDCIKNTIGLGDVIETIAEKTGIKKVVKAIFGGDCGCEERKEKLNKIVLKTKFNPRCMTPEELTDLRNKLNTQDNNEVPARYGVISIPTFLLIKDGEVKQQIVGSQPYDKFKELVTANI